MNVTFSQKNHMHELSAFWTMFRFDLRMIHLKSAPRSQRSQVTTRLIGEAYPEMVGKIRGTLHLQCNFTDITNKWTFLYWLIGDYNS